MILRAQPDLKIVLTTLVNKVTLIQSAFRSKTRPGPSQPNIREDIQYLVRPIGM